MRRRLYIPDAVQVDIARQVRRAVADTLIEFESAEEDEDAFTGHLGARLTTRHREVIVDDQEVSGTWNWSLQYRKFRGRGPGATEKQLGADGIFELTLERKGGAETKSLLFQSKMGSSGGRDLVEQCAKLSTWREASVVLSYEPHAIRAITIDEALRTRGALQQASSTEFGDYIGRLFIACHVGDNDLYYDARKRELAWRTVSGEVVAARFSVAHRFKVRVQPPGLARTSPPIDRFIPQDEVHKYRMDSTSEDLLSVSPGEAPQSAATAIRALSKIYHPDLYTTFSLDTREMMKVRMQEFNEAYQERNPKQRKGR
ncbi:MAG TPA: hypothetical protein VF680_02485 [Allosphingosinicella sp.]|jgi:hypothetical protein